MELQIGKKLNYLIQALTEDYFAVFLVDFSKDIVEVSHIDESVVSFVSEFLSKSKGYTKFAEYYAEHYICEDDKAFFRKSLEQESVQKNLVEKGKYSISARHMFHNRNNPAEITIIDVSDNSDGSQCVITVIFVEDIIHRQFSLKEQDDMIRTLIRDYNSIYYIDLEKDLYVILQAQNSVNYDVSDYDYRNIPYYESVKRFAEKFVREEDRENMLKITTCEYIKQRLESEEGYSFRYQIIPKNGMRYFEARILRVGTEKNGHFAIMTVRNIDEMASEEFRTQSEIEKINKELGQALHIAETANRAKTDFLSRMSHDIRTPMNAIIGITAIAGAHIDDKEKLKYCLEKITSSSRHLLSIINDILDMSRIESGKMHINETEFNISDMVMDTLEIIKPQIREKHHDMKVYIKKIKHEKVLGDCGRIQQALLNLLSNAVKYTPDGGRITITTEERKAANSRTGTYVFTVKDNGIGMSEEFIRHIFEPFERAEDLRISKIQGTGLGMAITHNIIHLMGGTIEVRSEYGKGSCFKIILPLKLQETEKKTDDEFMGLHVLVADDDHISCESTCLMLDELGMNSEWVLSGQEALEKTIQRHREDNDYFAVILDWKMPEMDGIETMNRIRKETGPDVPVIIFSAYDWSDVEFDAKEAGVNAFISKPVFASRLRNVFRDIMHPENKEDDIISDLSILKNHDFSGKRILLVEDNKLNREIMTEIVATTNVDIVTAEDGVNAVNEFKNNPAGYFDMIFMDIQMPNMNGLEATRKIRALDHEDASSVPIIALTANTFEEDIHEALRAGMNEHMAKPIDLTRLEEVMSRWIKL